MDRALACMFIRNAQSSNSIISGFKMISHGNYFSCKNTNFPIPSKGSVHLNSFKSDSWKLESDGNAKWIQFLKTIFLSTVRNYYGHVT